VTGDQAAAANRRLGVYSKPGPDHKRKSLETLYDGLLIHSLGQVRTMKMVLGRPRGI